MEAARRAFDKMWPKQGDFEFNFDNSSKRYAEAAAREALAPIRDLHRSFADYYRNRDDSFSAGIRHVLRDLAYLVYSDSELTGGGE